MIRTKDELKRYIEYETRNFDHPILLKIPVDLYESQIIARYLILHAKSGKAHRNESDSRP